MGRPLTAPWRLAVASSVAALAAVFSAVFAPSGAFAPPSAAAADIDQLVQIHLAPPRPILSPQEHPGTTPAGAWRTDRWRIDLGATRIAVGVDIELAPHPLGLRSGPTVLFWSFGFEQLDPEGDRLVMATAPIQRVLLEACPTTSEPCLRSLDLAADVGALVDATGRRARIPRAWLALSAFRTWEDGTLIQELVPGPAEPGAVATLARSRPNRGPFQPSGLFPIEHLFEGYPEIGGPDGGTEVDLPGIVRASLHESPARARGPDPWAPVSVALRGVAQASCENYFLALQSGTADTVLVREIAANERLGLAFETRVARGGEWSLRFLTGEATPPLLEPFLADAGAYRIDGQIRCGGGSATGDLEVVATAPAPVDSAGPGAADPAGLVVAAGGLALSVLVGAVAVAAARARFRRSAPER